MGSRDHRYRLPNGIDASRPTRCGDGREPRLETLDAARVQVGAWISVGLHPRVNGRRHHITRRQVSQRVNTGGNRPALPVKQYRAFAANCLGDQRTTATTAPVEQHGRVELDEFEIADRDAGP